MFRNGTSWTTLRSRLSGIFASIRSFKLGSKKSHSTSQTSDTPGIINPYTNMDTAGSKNGAMEHSKYMRTFISSGQPKELNDDKIHLNYAFTQEVSNQPNSDRSLV